MKGTLQRIKCLSVISRHLFSEYFGSRRGHACICEFHRRLVSNLHHKGPPPLNPYLKILSCCQSNSVPPRPDFVVLCVSAIRLKLTFTSSVVFTTYISCCKQKFYEWITLEFCPSMDVLVCIVTCSNLGICTSMFGYQTRSCQQRYILPIELELPTSHTHTLGRYFTS